MPKHVREPVLVQAAGTPPKQIEEFIGRVSSGTGDVSIARMKSPEGWCEPGQRPEFDEYTVVLKGKLKVQTENGDFIVEAGQALTAFKGEWVQYSTPFPEGAEYMAVCVPAFSPDTVHRDQENH
jgi:mannose-6-phosphate isomerase-like protein (cupin superfamily)